MTEGAAVGGDAKVGVLLAETAARAAALLVRVNGGGEARRGRYRPSCSRSCSGVTPSARSTSPPVPLGSEAIASRMSSGPNARRPAAVASVERRLQRTLRPRREGEAPRRSSGDVPSPTRLTISSRAASTRDVEAADAAAQQREQQVLGAEIPCLSESASCSAPRPSPRARRRRSGRGSTPAMAAVAPACVSSPSGPGEARPPAGAPSTIWWTRWCESSSTSAISRSEPPAAWSFLIAWW